MSEKELKFDDHFDRNELSFYTDALHASVNMRYDLCQEYCHRRVDDNVVETSKFECKQNCFSKIQVPYKILKHQAFDSEEHLFRQCLANKAPHISHNDYAECSNNIHHQRIELLMRGFYHNVEGLIADVRKIE